jgi:hypothetical protein
MDLNYLFHRQQVERSKAAQASSEAARRVHLQLATAYEEEIERLSGGSIRFGPDGSNSVRELETSAGAFMT